MTVHLTPPLHSSTSVLTPLDAARRYHARGLALTPTRGKKAFLDGWHVHGVPEADFERYFAAGYLVGVLNGAINGNLTDTDLDAPEAIAVADQFIPATALVFGRKAKRRSHRYHRADPLPTTAQFRDIDSDGTMLVELRSSGSQTVWPPGPYPGDEASAFDADGEPAQVDGNALHRAVVSVAICALLARHWPRTPGSRHAIALAAAGFLLRAGLDAALVKTIVGNAARVAGDDEVHDRLAAVVSTAVKLDTSSPTTGAPTLAMLLGDRFVGRLGHWLRTVSGSGGTDGQPAAEPPPDPAPPGDGDTGATNGDGTGDARGPRTAPWSYALSAPAFLAEIEQTPDWLVEGILMPGAVTWLNSPRGLGKTNAGLAYAVQLARAGKRVLLFDRDNPKPEIRRRLRAWGAEALDTIEILSREHAPALTDPAAWKKFPLGTYDAIVIDSWDASTEGVGEQDSAKPSKAQAVLLDLAHRENGPAIFLLANTTKRGEAGRGAGTLEDREDIVCEVRDATGLRPTGRADWWTELPDPSRAAWGARAARRVNQDRLRLAFVYSEFRVGKEPDPFIVEIDFTTTPWSLWPVTAEVVAAGEAAKQAAADQAAHAVERAMEQLRAEVERRAREGEPAYRKEKAVTFLSVLGIKQKQGRELVDQGDGTHWRLVKQTTERGQPIVLQPLNQQPQQRKTPAAETVAAQGVQKGVFSSSASGIRDEKQLDGNPGAAGTSEDDVSRRRASEREPIGHAPGDDDDDPAIPCSDCGEPAVGGGRSTQGERWCRACWWRRLDP
jgi:AAA domain